MRNFQWDASRMFLPLFTLAAMNEFKVPDSIPQDLLLIQDIIGTIQNPVQKQPPETKIDDEDIDSSGSSDDSSSDDSSSDDDSSEEVDQVEADLIVKEEDTEIP